MGSGQVGIFGCNDEKCRGTIGRKYQISTTSSTIAKYSRTKRSCPGKNIRPHSSGQLLISCHSNFTIEYILTKGFFRSFIQPELESCNKEKKEINFS